MNRLCKFILICIVTKFVISHGNPHSLGNVFSLKYQWDLVNYTWPTYKDYQNALDSGKYIPERNQIIGLKIYKDQMYFAIPRLLPGIPVTLASLSKFSSEIRFLEPFPSWMANEQSDCSRLQSIQSMEIDPNGIMWVIDGERLHNQTRCPAKLICLDLNKNGKIVHKYIFPNEIVQTEGGLLNDIVIDQTDGDFAYITNSGYEDPGLIVYSRAKDTAWKLRDKSMFPDVEASNYLLGGSVVKTLVPINGIALSPPISSSKTNEKLIFYSALTSYNLYSISNRVLKNETFCKGDQWRRSVTFVGRKQSQSDGLAFDNTGNLYYTLMSLSGVGRWNFRKPFNTSIILARNSTSLLRPNSFAFDKKTLYLLSNKTITTYFANARSYLYIY